jgi:hypothetical protein
MPPQESSGNPERKSIGQRLFEAFLVGQQRRDQREVDACLGHLGGYLPDKQRPCRAAVICIGTPNVSTAGTLTRAFAVRSCEVGHAVGKTFDRNSNMRYRGWFVAIATTMAAISWQGRAPALGDSSIAQSEAASITAHGGGMTLRDCMALWDSATHMSKEEWKASCKRTMVLESNSR